MDLEGGRSGVTLPSSSLFILSRSCSLLSSMKVTARAHRAALYSDAGKMAAEATYNTIML